jgi:hypothetical protein
MTRELLRRLPADARLLVLRTANGSSVESAEIIAFAALKPSTDFFRRALAFEIDPRFVNRLRQTLPAPRLRVIAASAERLHAVVCKEGWSRVDGVISSGHDPFVCPNLSPFDSAGNARDVIFYEERVHYRDGYRAQ